MNKEDLIKLYDKNYVNKIASQTKKKNIRLLKYINFNHTDNVVDYACGSGSFASIISSKVTSYIGVDFSKAFVDFAEHYVKTLNLQNCIFYCDDIVKFSENNISRFDKAFALDFTEHIYDEDFLKIFISIRETLKDGSLLFIHTPNGDYFMEKLKKWGVLKQFPEHIAVRNSKDNVDILKKVGFSSVELVYIPHYLAVLSWLHFLSFIPIIGKFFKARLLIICKK